MILLAFRREYSPEMISSPRLLLVVGALGASAAIVFSLPFVPLPPKRKATPA